MLLETKTGIPSKALLISSSVGFIKSTISSVSERIMFAELSIIKTSFILLNNFSDLVILENLFGAVYPEL